MPPSFRPTRAFAPRAAALRRRSSSAIAFSRCCSRRRSCCWRWRSSSRRKRSSLLAPGFSREPQQFALAVSLTRITFPYLLLITLVTLWGGILNALHRFAAAAAAPILLNVAMMATLALPAGFRGAGYAAAWGVLISGVLQAVLVGGDTCAPGVMTSFPRAALGRRRAALLQGAGSGDRRLGRHAAGAVRRHHHRQLSVGRRDLGALLRRPHRPAADRRHRHCRRHRAGAGDDAPARRRRRSRRPLGAEPRHRICASCWRSLRRRVPGGARPDHARLVHARRVSPPTMRMPRR